MRISSFLPLLSLGAVSLGFGACLLPSYESGSSGSTSSSSSTGSGGGAPSCPTEDFDLHLGTDSNVVHPGSFAWLKSGHGVLTGQFTKSLLFKSATDPILTADPNGDGFVVGVDRAGKGEWAFPIAGMGSEFPGNVAATPDGGAIVAGGANQPYAIGAFSSATFTNMIPEGFLLKIDAGGNPVWLVELDAQDPNSMAGLGSYPQVAVDPASGDIYATGGTDTALQALRQPEPLASPMKASKSPTSKTSPYYVHLTPDGQVKSLQIWSSDSGAAGTAAIVMPNQSGNHYVFGYYVDAFPDVKIVPTPPNANNGGADGFGVRFDKDDFPLDAFAFGALGRSDAPFSAALVGGSIVLASFSRGGGSPTTDFKVLDKSTTIPGPSNDFAAVFAAISPDGTSASWVNRQLTSDTPTSLAVADRRGKPMVSWQLGNGATQIGGQTFMSDGKDTLLLELGEDGSPTSYLSFLGQGSQLGRYMSSPCGDGLLFNLAGSATFNGKLETTQSDQAFLTFSSMPLGMTPF